MIRDWFGFVAIGWWELAAILVAAAVVLALRWLEQHD